MVRARVLYAGLVGSFIAGAAASTLLTAVSAQPSPTPLTAQVIDLAGMSDEAIGPLIPNTDLRSRLLGATDGATVSVQSGNVFKHFHADANEIQYIIEGSGSFWLGDKEMQIKPGDLIMIPKGTVHAGSKAATGRFKAIAFKTPPQRSDDTKRVD